MYLRWCKSVESQKEQYEPKDCINSLDGELCSCEQERKQRDVTRHGQRAEGAEVSTVAEGHQAERDDDKQNCFLMNVPAEEERGVAAQSDRTNEGLPRRFVKETQQDRLLTVRRYQT